jgi:hypothetical protein
MKDNRNKINKQSKFYFEIKIVSMNIWQQGIGPADLRQICVCAQTHSVADE